MSHSLTRIRKLCAVSCLLAGIIIFPASSTAAETTRTVRLDGKTVLVPETKITQGTTPVASFLFVGAWETTAVKIQTPLCDIDANAGAVLIDSPQTLLKGSKTKVLTSDDVDKFLNDVAWGPRQTTHLAFNITSPKRQPAVVVINTNFDAALFQNGAFSGSVSGPDARNAGGRGYFPVMLEAGANIMNIKLLSYRGKPQFQMAVCTDHSLDLAAAWQPRHGLLKKLVYSATGDEEPVRLDWNPNLSFSLSLEVRDVSTDKIVYQRDRARRGRVIGEEDTDFDFAPGIYEITYHSKNENTSEFFMIGQPADMFTKLQDSLEKYTPDSESKLDIRAQLRRARILLVEKVQNTYAREWQEKLAYTFSCLATFERLLKGGATNIAKDQPGLHIRGFVSGQDSSNQFYRLYIPTTYKPGEPLPLLVIPAARMSSRQPKPFVAGPIIRNHREALLWAKSAEQHGFALLWPGYAGAPDGYSYESVHINEAIQAVEKDYAIDTHRISVYGTCSAGYNAGRLVQEYNNRFAAIVYDLAVFDLSLDGIQSSPSLMEWYTTVNPSRHVIDNKNIKIFVLHDDTRLPGHGPLELTKDFLERASKIRSDVASYISDHPITMGERMDKAFSWLASCKNEKPDDKRSNFLANAGYTGPIMEIFATPLLIVEGTHAQGGDLENIHNVVESLKVDYKKYFRGAQCAVKKDDEVTQDDIDTHSLILVGNPQSNSVWEKLQPKLTVKMTPIAAMYGNDRLTGAQPFQAIVRHPAADGKYILLIGAGDLRSLAQVTTDKLFTAWYDCFLYSPDKIISKLDALGARSGK